MVRLVSLVLVALSAAAFSSAAQETVEPDANAVYERFAAAYVALDAEQLAQTGYHPDAVYLRRGGAEFAVGRTAIQAVFEPMFANMAENDQTPELSFRLQSRLTGEDLIADAGWYRFRVYDDAGAVLDTSYGRFMTVQAQREDGSWAFVRDIDSPATEELWSAQRPVDGLYYDE